MTTTSLTQPAVLVLIGLCCILLGLGLRRLLARGVTR